MEDGTAIGWKLFLTALFVAINGFFVAAEFGLVKVRPARMDTLASQGNRSAKVAQGILANVDLYLSACQLGITISSLVLGWLAEPAVAELLLLGAHAVGIDVGEGAPVRIVALVLALTTITILHMTIGEQAPKIWAIHKAEKMTLMTAYPLRIFVTILRPLIVFINAVSNWMVRLTGLTSVSEHEGSHDLEELKAILASSARAGHISKRQRTLGENVLRMMNLEVRHVMVSRVDITFLSAEKSYEENLEKIRESGHSRFPWCEVDLDSAKGLVHEKDVFQALLRNETPDLPALMRKMPVVPDTQPLSRFIWEAQQSRTHCAIVADEHGTTVGMMFLEDALEEIVGPLNDEFDLVENRASQAPDGLIQMSGGMPLPEAADLLGIEFDDEADTIGGLIITRLGRMPVTGDKTKIGSYEATVVQASRNRIRQLEFRKRAASDAS